MKQLICRILLLCLVSVPFMGCSQNNPLPDTVVISFTKANNYIPCFIPDTKKPIHVLFNSKDELKNWMNTRSFLGDPICRDSIFTNIDFDQYSLLVVQTTIPITYLSKVTEQYFYQTNTDKYTFQFHLKSNYNREVIEKRGHWYLFPKVSKDKFNLDFYEIW